MKQFTITKSQFIEGDYPMKSYKQEANPNATNSELDAKRVIINNDNNTKKVIKRPKDLSPYDKIPKRY